MKILFYEGECNFEYFWPLHKDFGQKDNGFLLHALFLKSALYTSRGIPFGKNEETWRELVSVLSDLFNLNSGQALAPLMTFRHKRA